MLLFSISHPQHQSFIIVTLNINTIWGLSIFKSLRFRSWGPERWMFWMSPLFNTPDSHQLVTRDPQTASKRGHQNQNWKASVLFRPTTLQSCFSLVNTRSVWECVMWISRVLRTSQFYQTSSISPHGPLFFLNNTTTWIIVPCCTLEF